MKRIIGLALLIGSLAVSGSALAVIYHITDTGTPPTCQQMAQKYGDGGLCWNGWKP